MAVTLKAKTEFQYKKKAKTDAENLTEKNRVVYFEGGENAHLGTTYIFF